VSSSRAEPFSWRRLLGALYVQVLVAVAAGIMVGALAPGLGGRLRPLGDGFIKLIKMLFLPVIFTTVALGIARMESLRDLGRVGVRALVYFEAVSTFALLLGLVVVNVVGPGRGMNVDPATLDTRSIQSYTAAARHESVADFILNLIPASVVDALARNEILQVLLFSILLGVALARLRERAEPLAAVLDALRHALFVMVGMVMRLAPLAAFGAMAFTVGTYGFRSLLPLATLVASMYATCALFVLLVLGTIARVSGFSLWSFLRYLKDELALVLGTASSESVLPQIMRKLENVGCSRAVVGLVVPSGLAFNPDGQCIYYTLAAVFVAQATNTPLTLGDQLLVLGVLMVTSKGSAGVTGSGFITLAATLASLGKIPVSGMVLLLGIDRFMSEARALTNTIGNSVGTMAIARWVGALDRVRMQKMLAGEEGANDGCTIASDHSGGDTT